ncbi:MAG: Sporulation related domain [Rhodobacteraceae bacterium HLUCCO07]|nr:MAG: Sporulation related domain [Rhodobacteraceae bacterium HLUCCO07]
MADIPLGDPVYGAHAGSSTNTAESNGGGDTLRTLGTVMNWAGAAVSLALVVGISVWGYKMLARDVSAVPVVRAAEGKPMRVQPENPGGRPALHQGLAVNSVAALGPAAKPADQLILAPAPVDLSEEDVALSAVQPVKEETSGPEREQTANAESGSAKDGPDNESMLALADRLAAGAERLDTGEPAEKIQHVAAIEAAPVEDERNPEPEARLEVKGGIKQSLRPVLRPEEMKQTAAAGPATEPEEIDPESIAKGTRLAQLGAFESAEVARREWDRLSERFGDYLEGKQRVIQKAQSGGRTFYRLRAMGFADLNDARRFCSALQAERGDCIPVTTR